jgi:hypothetical protein
MPARNSLVRFAHSDNAVAGFSSVVHPDPTTGKFDSPESRLSVVPSKFKPVPEPEDLDYILARTLVVLGGGIPKGEWKEIVQDGIVLFDRSILFDAPSKSTLMLSIHEIATGGAERVRVHIDNHMQEWRAGELRAEQEFLKTVAY